VIALAAAASLAVGVWVSRAGSANMSAIVKTRSQLEPGVTNLAYKRGIDACSNIGASSQTASSFRHLLAYPTDPRDFVTARLQQITAVNTIECACLIDKNMTVLVAAHAPDLHGTHYDPAGVVSSTLRTYKRHTRTAVIGIDEFRSLNPPLRRDKKSLTTPDSNLLPTISGLDALVRYTSTPMWIAGPAVGLATGAPPDGVLVTADNVNVSERRFIMYYSLRDASQRHALYSIYVHVLCL
jgi:hypothetical protein